MGIQGLYSFLRNKNKYLSNYSQLDNSKLIIDGTSISYHLLHSCMEKVSGNPQNLYQIYSDYTINFFQKCFDHNIDIFVFVNGVWEETSLDSQMARQLKQIQDPPKDEKPIDYLFYDVFKHNIFVEVLKKLNINFFVCPFNATHIIATVAKISNYPVVTANSDLFLYGVNCIFFHDFQFKKNNQPNIPLTGRILRPHQFIKIYPGLDIFCLPLLTILLNDDDFKNENLDEIFLSDSSRFQQQAISFSQRVDKIKTAFNWLSNHTLDSAVQKIFDKITEKSLKNKAQNIFNLFTTLSTYMLKDLTNLQFFTINERKISAMKHKFLNYEWKYDNDMDTNGSAEKVDTASKTLSMIPDWFINDVKNGKINPYIIDLFRHETYTIWIQAENMEQPSMYEMSMPLIEFIYRLILPYINENETSPLKIIIRKGHTIECRKILVQKYHLSLEDVRQNMEIKLKVINNILLGVNEADPLHYLPQDWRLYFATIVFWMKQDVEPKKDKHHLYALLLSMVFSILKKKIENDEDNLFEAKFFDEVESISHKGNVEKKTSSLMTALARIKIQDLREVADWILPLFEEKPKTNKITMNTYHIFLQFQCCLEHTKIINSLLGFPYDDTIIHEVIYVSLTKNIFNEISLETMDPEKYIENKLKNVPCILEIFQIFNSLL